MTIIPRERVDNQDCIASLCSPLLGNIYSEAILRAHCGFLLPSARRPLDLSGLKIRFLQSRYPPAFAYGLRLDKRGLAHVESQVLCLRRPVEDSQATG